MTLVASLNCWEIVYRVGQVMCGAPSVLTDKTSWCCSNKTTKSGYKSWCIKIGITIQGYLNTQTAGEASPVATCVLKGKERGKKSLLVDGY